MARRTPLFIDRFSFTLAANSRERAHIHSAVQGLVQNEELVEADWKSGLRSKYVHAYVRAFGKSVFAIQFHPRRHVADEDNGPARFFRAEWNPAGIARHRSDAPEQVIELLEQILPLPWSEIIWRASITRLDLTFDVWGVHIDRMALSGLSRRLVVQRYESGITGRLNSVLLGSIESDRRLRVYDRRLLSGLRQFTVTTRTVTPTNRGRRTQEVTRFELVLKNLGPIQRLESIRNPYLAYTVRYIDSIQRIYPDHFQAWFLACCRATGLQQTVSAIANRAERERVQRAVKMSEPPDWWCPSKIWEELPAALRLGLAGARTTSDAH